MKENKENDSDVGFPDLRKYIESIKRALASMELEERVLALNKIREELSELSPFLDPVDLVQWVPEKKVYGNHYNPNRVAPLEMQLLHTSVKLDGFTQPIVAYRIDGDHYEIIDGFHRSRIGKEYPDIRERVKGYLPLTIINKPIEERMGSTIRHNRARGTHQIRSMSDIVVFLSEMGWTESDIGEYLGMELDEVIRLKQISGLKQAFQNHTFSKSWREFQRKYYK